MSNFTDLVVVSSASWLAEDFKAPGKINIVPSLGFELPVHDPVTTAWWCSGIYAARVAATGKPLSLLSAGSNWMDRLPLEWKGRRVTSMTVARARARFNGGFIKPSEIKVSKFPARLYKATRSSSAWLAFLNDVEESNLPNKSMMTVSEPMDYVEEYRCFIAHGAVTAVSAYLINGVTWDAMEPDANEAGCRIAADFANAMLSDLGSDAYPPGFVVDIGLDRSGKWSVIEANASWSSNPYHSQMSGVIDSVLAAHDPHGKNPEWTWKIDPYHQMYARPLPRGKQ